MTIVNFATKYYAAGQRRLDKSIPKCYNKLLFNDYSQIGSPTHQQSPYEFKIHAIRKALGQDDIVLWCDASLWVVGDLHIIENIIKTDGYFFEEAGHYCGRWTNQHTRNYFGVTEEEMKQGPGGMTMFSAGLTGLNKNSALAMWFLDRWEASAKASCFKGSYEDHRHDMTCGSIIANRLGMKYQTGGTHMAYIGQGYEKPKDGVVFYLQGL